MDYLAGGAWVSQSDWFTFLTWLQAVQLIQSWKGMERTTWHHTYHFLYLDLTFGAEEVFTVCLFSSITATLTGDEGKVIKQVSFSSASM